MRKEKIKKNDYKNTKRMHRLLRLARVVVALCLVCGRSSARLAGRQHSTSRVSFGGYNCAEWMKVAIAALTWGRFWF